MIPNATPIRNLRLNVHCYPSGSLGVWLTAYYTQAGQYTAPHVERHMASVHVDSLGDPASVLTAAVATLL